MPAVEGDFHLCKALQEKNEHAILVTKALGLPQSCPYEKVSFICSL